MAKPKKAPSEAQEQQTISLMAAIIFGGESKAGLRITSREAVDAALKIYEHVDQLLHAPDKYELSLASKEVEQYIQRAKAIAKTPTEKLAVGEAERINQITDGINAAFKGKQ